MDTTDQPGCGAKPPYTGQEAAVPEGPVFNQFNLVVRDMDATVAFYRRLGLEVEEPPAEWADRHRRVSMPGGLDLDFDSEEFAGQWDTGWKRGRMGVLGFQVDSSEAVDALYADLTDAGYHGEQEPFDAFWGARYAIVEDPDGNPVGIMGPISR
jgi:catechol 2,3-dioxygenase-like lactoylglutathione lyase family enzyme